MKTITEFAAVTLKNAAKTQQELQAAGKTADDMPQAMGEALKLEGDKLNHLLNALEAVGGKLGDLKRVLVMTVGEGEKAPTGAKQKGEHYFAAEYYPPIAGKGAPHGRDHHGKGKGDKRGDRKGKGRGGRGGPRGERSGAPRGERSGAPGGGTEAGGRGPRPPRGPKPAREGGKPEATKQ